CSRAGARRAAAAADWTTTRPMPGTAASAAPPCRGSHERRRAGPGAAMRPRIRQLLLDFDNVLAHYRREQRVAHLAAHAGTGFERVWQALYGSGLEARYDAGEVSTADYLQALGEGIGAPVDEDAWLDAR